LSSSTTGTISGNSTHAADPNSSTSTSKRASSPAPPLQLATSPVSSRSNSPARQVDQDRGRGGGTLRSSWQQRSIQAAAAAAAGGGAAAAGLGNASGVWSRSGSPEVFTIEQAEAAGLSQEALATVRRAEGSGD
jgi:hypothetical protein